MNTIKRSWQALAASKLKNNSLWLGLSIVASLAFSNVIFASVHRRASTHKLFTVTTIYSTDKTHKKLGTITAFDSKRGLRFDPKLFGLPPGLHGFHLHQFAKCSNGGKDAGGHWDPQHTGHHAGPYRLDGHRGDLPPLTVNAKGQALKPVIAPHLKLADLAGHSLMIHADGDNFSDKPAANGGGGARIACGTIAAH